MEQQLQFDVKNSIATITLNRPNQLNSFSIEMITKWIKALEEVRDREDINVLVVTGTGKAFSTGGDLKAVKNEEGFFLQPSNKTVTLEGIGIDTALERKNSLWKLIQRVPILMEEIDKPIIAAVNGLAIGAGMDMALACDIRFCSDQATFSEGYIKLGLIPGDGGTYFLPRIVGVANALELLWSGKELNAQEANNLGIVSRVIPHEKLMEETYQFASKLANSNADAIKMIKRSVYQSLKLDLRSSLDMASSHMAVITDSNNYKEKIDSLMNKKGKDSVK